MRPFHRAAAAAAAVLLPAGGPAGCTMLDDAGSSGDSASGASGVAVEGGDPSVDATGDAIVAATLGAPPQAPSAEVEIAVLGLRVRGKLATLTVRMTPRIPPGGPDKASPYDLNGNEGIDPSLIDPVNLKRYVVVKDSRGREMETDDITTDLVNGKAGALRYTFAAPPENVKALDLQFGGWPTFRDIPVQR
ncbi:hypothetical protein [Actinomadura sp. WAC 06369]|uniref:hypothetical protein n=1 Tax=Actinomadura sp. WAC 06369 TaxID=2203193 RepID=UPI000F7A5837|nr:hypothetical protein [Actinomadura sp. WAC 06369]RSN64106.1 hypothetical protein DMH08_18260 [Actinomadura sp. WAC 06369]